MRAALDGDRLVNDVAFDARGIGEAHLQAAQAADDATVDHDILGDDFALHRRGLADDQGLGANVALDGALDLDVAAGADVSGDRDVRG